MKDKTIRVRTIKCNIKSLNEPEFKKKREHIKKTEEIGF